jgi:ABC-2 type transport system permease protein
MPVLLITLTLIGKVSAKTSISDWGQVVFSQLGLGVILPLTALIVGSSVLGLEVEDGTITHLLTKPLPRHEIILAKLAVAWAVTTVAVAVPLAVAGVLAGDGRLAAGMFLGATIGALAYSALFLALSLLSRRPVGVGLVYIILWENLLTSFISGTRMLSIRHYAGAIAREVSSTGWLPNSMGAVTAVVLAAVFTVAGTVGATARLRTFSLTGETS